MIEEFADVVAIDHFNVTLVSQVKSSCGSCEQVKSCGSGQVAKAIPQRKLELVIPYQLDKSISPLQVGDSVVLGLPEIDVLSSAAQVYLLPLSGLVLFSGLGQLLVTKNLFSHELLGLLLGLFGGYLGYRLAKHSQHKSNQSEKLQPRILRKLVPNIINKT
jgi:sigma-E factor negative regulatory protein RseC